MAIRVEMGGTSTKVQRGAVKGGDDVGNENGREGNGDGDEVEEGDRDRNVIENIC
jgi:hypothetical protein